MRFTAAWADADDDDDDDDETKEDIHILACVEPPSDKDDPEHDHVGVETRAAVGAEEEKTEDQARQLEEGSEAEERAFYERVLAATRMRPKARRFYIVSCGRFTPPVPWPVIDGST